MSVTAQPYTFPYAGGALSASDTALILIDMQVDFCGHGGYVDQMGYDISATRAPIEPLKRVLAAARHAGVRVLHTREGHRPSLADLPANKRWRSEQIGAGIGSPGPCGRVLVRGAPGWELIDDLAPLAHEDVIDKCGKGSFHATDLDMVLRTCGVTKLVLGGITTDVCVHTTMREANDRGYECCIVADGTGATDAGNHAAALKMVTMQHGVFGAVAPRTPSSRRSTPCRARRRGAARRRGRRPRRGSSRRRGARAALSPAKPRVRVAVGARWRAHDRLAARLPRPGGLRRVARQRRRAAPVGRARSLLLEAARARGLFVAHTLEAHAADLGDCPPSKKRRCEAIGETLDASRGRVLVRGEPGNAVVPELAPAAGELVVHKPGKGAFYGTTLERDLRAAGVTHLVVTGVTTEVCVQSTLREANDRGFDCLLVEDATESYFPAFKRATLDMVVAQGGIVGWTATAGDVAAALAAAA
ncbi:isochorismatase-like protein [Aureococcus anophagefferens]|nr:isochorismatase-like protein [Aureococcus anophagefferens]